MQPDTPSDRRARWTAPRRRAGLAPLELVLCLPFLLLIMAVIVNYGTAASWKLRASSVARLQAFSHRLPRTGQTDPWPAYWSTSAKAGISDSDKIAALDDPRVNLPVARGPLPQGANVDADLLDPKRGLREGTAEITRDYPLLPKLGKNHRDAKLRMLDDNWQYWRMGLPSTVFRRIPRIYTLFQAPAQRQPYLDAAVSLHNAPFKAQLRPLDRDNDFAYYGQLVYGSPWRRDFHPFLSRFCTLDEEIARQRGADLVDHIQGNAQKRIPNLVERMTREFLAFYQGLVAAANAQIKGAQADIQALQQNMADPSVPANVKADIPGQIQQLHSKIGALHGAIGQIEPQIPILGQVLETIKGSKDKRGP